VGSISGAYLGGWMANNAYQEEQKFNRQTAAQQLSIEINSINQSIQPYVYEYMRYYDFADGNGEGLAEEAHFIAERHI
jgi:hypothetical protein